MTRRAASVRDATAEPLRVLIVDDDAASRVTLHALLTELGYVCESAPNGNRALSMHRAHPFDVILSDWAMPEGDGMGLCEAVRAMDGDVRFTYFALMTAHADKPHLLEALRGGADDFIAKPIDIEVLEARLVAAERVIRLHRMLSRRNRSLRRDSERFFRAAHVDPLTRLANRRQLDEDLPRLPQRAARSTGNACIAIVDVDHFKLYNDRFGHLAGDQVLRRVAESIKGSLRASDSVYRYGGEEFLVVLPEQSASEARVAAERLRHGVESMGIENPDCPGGILTVSLGLAALNRQDAHDPMCWLASADSALYRAKQLGRNRCEQAPRPEHGDHGAAEVA